MILLELLLFAILIFFLSFLRGKIAYLFQIISTLLFNSFIPGIIFYSIFFLPGVLIHELSHLITSELLGVRTGRIHIFPQEIKPGNLRMGSVESEQTDPLRELLIGSAPLFVGLAMLFSIISFVFKFESNILDSKFNIFLLYLSFAIANTMFVSKEDRRAWWFIPILLVVVAAIIYSFKLNENLVLYLVQFESNITDFLIFINEKVLLFCVMLDIFGYMFLIICKKIIEKITGRRLVLHKP